MLEECLRRVYWHYYGSWNGWNDDADPTARLAYKLKGLSTPPLVVGNIVHLILGRWLRTHISGEPFPLERLTAEAMAEFDRPAKPVVYWSDVYSDGLDAELISEARNRVRWLLQRASGNSYIRRLARIPSDRIVLADETRWADKKVDYCDIDLYGMPDFLAYSENGSPNFIDWKTGRGEAKDAEAQMGAQALFAREKFGIQLSSARAHIVYLDSGDVTLIDNLEAAATEAAALVDSFITDMRRRLSDPDGNVAGDMERFPMSGDHGRCKLCNFKKLCNR